MALAVLFASTGVSITLGQVRQARTTAGRLTVVLVVTSVTLPALAWAASRLTGPGPLRDGVLVTGVAPAEVASVAIAGIAGGRAALTAALLIGSTLVTVVAAGPILAALGATATIGPTALLTQLVLVVALPLAAGITTRATLRPTRSLLSACAALGILALLILLWQVASQITLRAAYVPVTLALLAFLAGSAALGWLLTLGLPPPRRLALALPVAMRDFAVAAGIAAAAFGPAAAAPLGIYGALVLLAGALAVQRPRARTPAAGPER
ncbi:hypothetical protein [Modestobacter sp. DSM 44400]|uniref:hypothetical protein n=1 Tax=Modestobacter sp. DSM 44400 TaxID=1550230 RepID=UPI0015872E13|nr:hypothetical protein [Modestobacter sp. DSM 44400]